jgi:type I restriction enzyme M protein
MSNLSGFVKRLRDIMRNDAGINGDAQRIEQITWLLFLKVYNAKEQDWEFDDESYKSIIPEPCRWTSWAHDDKSGSAMTGDTLLDFVNNTLFPTLKRLPVNAATSVKKAIVQTTFADANNYMKDGVLLRQVINVIDELDLGDYEESHAFGEIYESILKELQSAGSAGEFYTPRAVTDFMAQMIRPRIGERMADFACGTGGFLISWLKVLQKQIQSTADAKKYGESVYGVEKKQFPYMLCITNLLLHNLDLPQVYHENSLLRDVLDYTEDDRFNVILMNPPYGGSEKADVKNHFPNDLASSETADLFLSVIMYRLAKDGRAAVILPDGFLFGTDNAKINIKKKLLGKFNLHTVIRMPGSVFSPYTSITTNILFFDRTGPTKETWFYRLDMPEGYKHFSKTKPMKLEHFAPAVEWWNNRRELTADGFDKAKKFTARQLAEEFGYNLDQCGYPHEEEEILAPLDLIQRYEEERSSLNAEIDRVLSDITAILRGGTP